MRAAIEPPVRELERAGAATARRGSPAGTTSAGRRPSPGDREGVARRVSGRTAGRAARSARRSTGRGPISFRGYMRSACLLIGVALARGRSTSPPARARAGCAPGVAASLASTGAASQLVTVVAPVASSTSGDDAALAASRRLLALAGGPWKRLRRVRRRLGQPPRGRRDDAHRRVRARPGDVRRRARPGAHFAYHRLVCGDWWDEDPSSPAYNTFQHVPCGTRPPFAGASEALWRSTRRLRRTSSFVEYNTLPAVPGKGSAIFIHVEIGHPTNGCISLPPARARCSWCAGCGPAPRARWS